MEKDWLLKAHNLIHERFQGRLTLRMISAEVGVHPAHLSRVFHRHYGQTVGFYIRMLRIKRAIKELSLRNKSLVAVAMDSGFYDQSHFHHVFKRYTGLTPAEFMRSYTSSYTMRRREEHYVRVCHTVVEGPDRH